MKITLKTLQGKQLPLEIEDTSLVSDLKAQIEKEHDYPVDKQKLIAYGKVMDDNDKTLKDYKIVEGGFVVLMVQQAKPKPQQKKEESKPNVTLVAPSGSTAAAGTSATAAATTQAAATTSAASTTQVTGASASTATQQTSASQGLPTQAAAATSQAAGVDEEAIANLMASTGSTRETVIAALQAAYGDPNRAFEYCLDGIPEQLAGAGGAMGAMGAMAHAHAQGDDDMDDYGAEEQQPGGENPFAAFVNNPNFIMLRQRILQSPDFFQEFMEQLGQSQPEMKAAIDANPGLFMHALLGGGAAMGGSAGGQPGAHAHGQPRSGSGPAHGRISVTPEQMQAIQRLQSLGFSQNRAAQAFFACDENEELAANYLFESTEAEEQELMQEGLENSQGQPAAETQPAAQSEQQPSQSQEQPSSEQPSASDSNNQNNNNGGNGDGQGDGADPSGGAGAGGQPESSSFE